MRNGGPLLKVLGENLRRFCLVFLSMLLVAVPLALPVSAAKGIWKGKTFSLTDGQLYGMVHMAKHEQDSVEGIKSELSLMANKADKDNRSDIADYIRNSSWFASDTRSSYSESRGSLSDAEISAGRDVLENGNRVIPPQIVEHDCIGDLEWIELDGVKHYGSNPGDCKGTGLFKSEYYVSGKTKIHNTYGSTYIFYTFPKAGDINSGDPFGYFEGDTPTDPDGGSSSSSSGSSKLSDYYRSLFSQNDITNWDPSCNPKTKCVAPTGSQITWIGDSYSVGAEEEIKKQLSGIEFGGSVDDASSTIQGCKFVVSDTTCNAKPTNPSGLKVLKQVIDDGKLKPYLVFALGTNGGWTDGHVEQFKETISGQSVKVIFVSSKTATDNYTESNKILKALADSSDDYYYADWAAVAEDSYFAGDPEKTHPVSNGGYEKWVETIVAALPQNCDGGTTLPGKNTAEKVWNYLVSTVKNSGLSGKDTSAIVAGIMGNFYVESGLNPLMKGSSSAYYGLYMLYGDYGGNDYVAAASSALGGNYFKFYGWWSDEFTVDTALEDAGLSQDQIAQAIKLNIEALTKGDTWSEFLDGVKSWGVADTPKGYSDLFVATVERAVNGDSPIEDAGVKKHYSGNYQGASARRDKAQYFYDQYADSSAVNPTTSDEVSQDNSGGITGNGKNYAGDTVWSEDQLAKVEQYKSTYQTAAQQYGIPWQAIASMHRLETGLSLTNPANGQGLYQLYTYTAGGTNSKSFPAGEVDMAEFQRQTNIAAEEMKGIIESGGYDPATDDGVKYLMFSYNGRAKQYKDKALAMGFSQKEAEIGEGSPYVMNRYDARRDPNSDEMDPNWPGRFTGDGVYTPGSTMSDFGGFVLYTALGGGSDTVDDPCPDDDDDASDLIGYVKKYVQPEHHDAPWRGADKAKPDFVAAVDERVSSGKYVGSATYYADCGGFVTTILNESGFGPEYNYGGIIKDGASNTTGGQLPYLRDHPDEWKLVNSSWNTPISDESELSPGDVAFSGCSTQWNCSHTYLYIGEVEGYATHIASASWDERIPMAGTEAIVGNNVNWFHRIK